MTVTKGPTVSSLIDFGPAHARAMNTLSPQPEGAATANLAECQIAVAYEGAFERDRVMRLLQTLGQRFTGELVFSCTWWKFRYLRDPDIALVARHYASAADIIIFATDSPGLFPLPVMNWIESWAAARGKPGGLLVPLIGSPNIPAQLYSTKHFYLRHVAERSKMDYLPANALNSGWLSPLTGAKAPLQPHPAPSPAPAS
jgi:hypothetical protein